MSAAGGRPVTRSRIVAFSAATGALTSFAPRIDGDVWAITAVDGSLYVGGSSTSVNGVARRGLVKLDPVTGAVDPRFNATLTGSVTEAAVVAGRVAAPLSRDWTARGVRASGRPATLPGPLGAS